MKTMELTLFTMPNCHACHSLKNSLDKLQNDNGYEYSFSYSIEDVSRREDLVNEYEIMSVPVLVFPTGYTLRHMTSMTGLKELLRSQQREWEDSDES